MKHSHRNQPKGVLSEEKALRISKMRAWAELRLESQKTNFVASPAGRNLKQLLDSSSAELGALQELKPEQRPPDFQKRHDTALLKNRKLVLQVFSGLKKAVLADNPNPVAIKALDTSIAQTKKEIRNCQRKLA